MRFLRPRGVVTLPRWAREGIADGYELQNLSVIPDTSCVHYVGPFSLPPQGRKTKPMSGQFGRGGWFLVDDGGIKRIFLAMRADLARFLVARGNSRDDAEDLLQDMFVKLETFLPGPVGHPRAYLYQMANNLSHDRRRAAARRIARNESWVDIHNGSLTETDPSPNAERVVVARDRLSRIEKALDGLPERTADIFRRFRIEGETQKAIANSLGISVSAVEKHLQRAYHVVLDARATVDAESDRPPLAVAGGVHND